MDMKFMDKAHKLYSFTRGEVTVQNLCAILSGVLECEVSFISTSGELLAGDLDAEKCQVVNERLLDILSTQDNLIVNRLGLEGDAVTMVTPVMYGAARLATVFVYGKEHFSIEDIVLAESAAAILSALLGATWQRSQEDYDRAKKVFKNLSESEKKAISLVLDSFDGLSGVVRCSNIADVNKLSRVIVLNALRKLDAGGLLEAKSAGAFGTKIQVFDRKLLEQILKDEIGVEER